MNEQKFKEIVKKVEAMKKSGEVDLSTEEDLSIAIMNLISLEEHFFFTGARTNKGDYYDLLNKVREMRKELLAMLIDKHEGETWCISKHLLATSMRLMEVGTKMQTEKKDKEAEDFFKRAFEMYSMFWAMRLKIVTPEEFKKSAEQDANDNAWTYQDIVNKLVDCCDE